MATQTFASATAAVRPLPASLAGSDPGAAPPLPAAQLARVLAGMVGQGHGIEAICLFLQLTREALLDLVVLHSLDTPHDRPRRRGGARAWTGADYATFIGCWLASWRAGSIAECLGRSPGSIWAQARRLGLPRRDRKSLVRPSECEARRYARLALHVGLQQRAPSVAAEVRAETARDEAGHASRDAAPASSIASILATPAVIHACGTAANAEAEAAAQPRAWLVHNAVTPVWVRLKGSRSEIDWDQALDDEFANRFWAYQHPAAAARDFGMSMRVFTSRYARLELPSRERSRLVEHYDPSVIAANIAEHGYVKRQCNKLSGWWFWSERRNGNRTSRRSYAIEAAATRRYAKAGIRRIVGAAAAIALPGSDFAFA